ncbi:MAG: ATP-binding protein [Thermoplasmata archaeon]
MSAGFDLNIEQILENWEPRHAVREIIANAIDEQRITKTRPIEISKGNDGSWQVRDYGRGLSKEHLTQAENPEKLANPASIGKFGIGLKDALATLSRRNLKVTIESRHGLMHTELAPKHGFEDIRTLHVFIDPPTDPSFTGTRFVIQGLGDEEMASSKDFFLQFAGDPLLEETKTGAILARGVRAARIYVNGVMVAQEDRFLFSYDVRSLTKVLRRALNRERSNVGRAAYQDRVKTILLESKTPEVARQIAQDLRGYSEGTSHDELSWIDVQTHAIKILNLSGRALFLTPEQLGLESATIDEARRAGIEIIPIPASLADRIPGLVDPSGAPVRGLEVFYSEIAASFQYQIVKPRDLTRREREVFDLTKEILSLAGGKPARVKSILISETMRPSLSPFQDVDGVWEADSGRIIVKRSQLRSLAEFGGTLVHEAAHARSGAPDVDRAFELELTRVVGSILTGSLHANSGKRSKRRL